MQVDNLSFSISSGNSTGNGTALKSRIYVYNPLRYSLIITALFFSVGLIGFVGNIFVLCFLKADTKTKLFLRTCAFEKNLNIYLRSLATSDVLSSFISVSIICVELNFDLFNMGWRCKLMRYLIILFPCITINNLLVINIEKYFSTRKVPRTFKPSTVKKMVLFAWLVGCVNVILPTLTFRGLRYNLNETHYTTVCRFDNHYLPFRIMYVSYAVIQYVIPMTIIIRINISLVLTVWKVTRKRKAINVQRDNGIKMKLRSAAVRSTCIIVALTLAFVIPYLFYFTQGIYNHVAKASIEFTTDFTVRAASALIAMANAVVNFLLYLLQMPDFRSFLKRKFKSWFRDQKPKVLGLANVEIQLITFSTLTLSTLNQETY